MESLSSEVLVVLVTAHASEQHLLSRMFGGIVIDVMIFIISGATFRTVMECSRKGAATRMVVAFRTGIVEIVHDIISRFGKMLASIGGMVFVTNAT